MPFVTWQDAPGVQGERWLGFCPHNTNVFATWHRPFVALYEVRHHCSLLHLQEQRCASGDRKIRSSLANNPQQELSKQVHIIASTATTDKPRWLAAADAFRMPYFDAGLGVAAGELPDFFTNPYIQVTGTSGTNVIANPLFQYDLPSRIKQDFVDDKNGGAKWTQYNHTLRYPDTYHTNARSQPDKFRSMWYGQRKMFQDGIGRAFAKTTFTTFATDLENWHGWFHNTGAGYGDYKSGHFLPSEYSAFDPLFMLHHA
jgi:tyrosinase